WTGAVGSSSYSSATPSGDSNLRSGVVDSATAAWRSLKRKYSDITIDSPGRGITSENIEDEDLKKELDDGKILMIYNKTATSYKYTSSSHNLDINSYYKLSVDVKTMLDNDNTDELAGAYINVSGGAEANWEAINTNGEWRTYTLYIETSELSSGSISIVLSNGIGSTTNGHMSKGYVFFDNVLLQKVSEVDKDDADAVAFTKADYDKIEISNTVAKYTMKTANAEFDFASSTTSLPYTPSKYTLVAGYGSGENSSTSSTYTVRGIIDTATFDRDGASSSLSALNTSLQSVGKTLADLTTPEASVGSRMLYMQNKQATAFGYRSSVAMNFATNKFYEVSIWAKTYITQGNATIRLTDGTNDDSNGYILTADSNDQWTKYTFYIEANQFRATSLYLELWLGFGGQNDNTQAVGAVLFDSLTLKEMTRAEYEATNPAENTQKKISLYTSEENMESISLGNFDIQNEKDVIANRSTFTTIDTNNFEANDYFKENPLKPVDVENSDIFSANVLAINNYLPTSTVLSTLTAPEEGATIDTSKLLNIEPNKTYAISMYVKTKDVDTSKGLTVSLLKYNEDYEGKDFSKMFTSVSSFTNLNTENLEDVKGFNDYTLITFYVLGAQIENTKLAISISLGSGDGSDYSTLAMGYGYVSSIYLEKIAYSNYSSASASTVINKVSLATSASGSEISSNGFFNFIDISATNNLFGDDWMDTPVLGLPTGWSSTNSSAITLEPISDAYPNMAGILNLNNQAQCDALGIINANDFYNGAEGRLSIDKNPNVLAIKKDDTMDMLGFKSSNISLSANTFYEFKVWAKANAGEQFSIILKTATASDERYKYSVITGDGAWHEYSIFVETGISSVSVTLSLNAGFENASYADSTVFFTHATYASIESSVFDNAVEKESSDNFRFLTQSWLVDSFDDVDSIDSIVAPKNFNGALVDSDASADEDTLTSGVIDKNRTDFSDIGIDTDKDEDMALYNAIFNNEKTNVGDRVLVIYNKSNTSYAYTSNSATITAGKYYKISIWVLTYKLASTDKVDDYFKPTATITLKANNKTYEFGRRLNSESSDYDKSRIVNTSTYENGVEKIGQWTEYAFYIYAEDDISSTTATLSVGLGFNSENYRMTGYVFVDNFSVDEIDEADFIARKDQYGEDEAGTYYKDGDNYIEITDSTPAPAGATLYKKLNDSEVAKLDNSLNSELKSDEAAANNFRIVFTSDDSNAEPEPDDPEDDETQKDPMMWLYISLGAVSGIIVVIVVIYLIKKFAPKRKKKLVKSNKGSNRSSSSSNSKRDQFGK
ncbi:MAG: hypothetical protein K2H36_04175, partial [Clostridia bacterium]|nr:hypothetical protein [Clostridia bacterium]